MATRLITLSDGTMVETEVRLVDEHVDAAERVDASIDTIRPVLLRVVNSVSAVWREVNKDLAIEQAEITFGLGFEGEGNIFITKATASANLSIKLTLNPKGT